LRAKELFQESHDKRESLKPEEINKTERSAQQKKALCENQEKKLEKLDEMNKTMRYTKCDNSSTMYAKLTLGL
jgi:hypothetical protein